MKHYTKIAVLLLLLLFSASCNKEEGYTPPPETDTEIETITAEPEPIAEPVIIEETPLLPDEVEDKEVVEVDDAEIFEVVEENYHVPDDVRQKYVEYLDKIQTEEPYTAKYFTLAHIDDDEYPEIIFTSVSNPYEPWGNPDYNYRIWIGTYFENEVHTILDYDTSAQEIYYTPKQNLVSIYTGSDNILTNRFGTESAYSIIKENNDKNSYVWAFCEYVFDRYRLKGANNYAVMIEDTVGNFRIVPIDEESFFSEYGKYQETLKNMNCRLLNNFAYEATEKDIRQALTNNNDSNAETNIPITEPEEIALSDEEMRPYRQQEAAAFKEKLLSEMNGESGVKFAVVSCVGTGMPELVIAKPLNPYGMYSMEIYQWDGELTSCGTIEGNNIQYILGGDGISITSYTDIGSADGSITSVSLNCYQYDDSRISLAETYNYTLQYTYDFGSMAVTETNKSYTVTASGSGVTETLTKDEFYQRIDNITVEYQIMLYDLTEENISAVLNDENSYPHSMAVENRTFFELYE